MFSTTMSIGPLLTLYIIDNLKYIENLMYSPKLYNITENIVIAVYWI